MLGNLWEQGRCDSHHRLEETVFTRVAKGMLSGLFVMGLLAGYADATQLITEQEAKLPPARGAVPVDRRGILRGPRVNVVLPEDASRSPLHLQLRFEAFGGAKIDPESVKMIYLRTPNVDLTPRIKSFIQASGIDIPETELPPGEYTVRIDLKDSDGRPGGTSFVLKVSP